VFLQTSLDKDIKRWLEEDIPNWDAHTLGISQDEDVKASIIAKQMGTISGIQVLKRIFELFNIDVTTDFVDGQHVQNGETLFNLKGQSNSILQAERTALNIFTHMSGITTMTANLVKMAEKNGSNIKIAGTRKTLPGLRKYQKYAIICGGGDPHRMNLESMIMLKENHISQFESVTDAIRSYKSKVSFSLKIEVEVQTIEQALEAAKEGVEIIMLDNFDRSELDQAIRQIREINSKVLIEISGGVSFNNIEDYLNHSVDIISSGALTHSNVVFDASLLFNKLL
jgi:nicotinate-nucleotide pyrophosphorylase (carboxylating)